MNFRILGPLEVNVRGRPLPLTAAKQKALLAILLLHPNEVVSSDRLIDELWGSEPPGSAANALQVYVSQLRGLLEPQREKGEPSAVLPAERNFLLNPAHPKFRQLRLHKPVEFTFDSRLIGR